MAALLARAVDVPLSRPASLIETRPAVGFKLETRALAPIDLDAKVSSCACAETRPQSCNTEFQVYSIAMKMRAMSVFSLPPACGVVVLLLLACTGLGAAAKAAAAAAAASKPHLVFFLADDYGFADVSYHAEMYGHDLNVISTPNLDSLSAKGVRLERYYVQSVCSPTRASLLTGRYVFRHGIHVPLIDSSLSALPLNETTVAERLRGAGYKTHLVGKWHLGFKSWACEWWPWPFSLHILYSLRIVLTRNRHTAPTRL